MNKSLLFLVSLAAWGLQANAQIADDALRYAFPLSSGTARTQAIGGAMGSLGGDITAAHINPAGIGLFKNKEFVLSPGFNLLNNKFDYRGSVTGQKDNGFAYGTSGWVFGREKPGRGRVKSGAWSLSVNQIANYNNQYRYSGLNNSTSWSEQYVEELVRNRATPVQAESNYIFGSSLAYWTYLVDTIADANGRVIGYQSLAPVRGNNAGVNQTNEVNTTGGAHEVTLATGGNINDKFYYGGSIGIPFYRYEKDQTFREEDASNNTNNDFGFFEYRENYTTQGFGFNVKLGLIYKPVDRLRLGFALHTPTWANLTDRISSEMTTNTEKYTIFQQPVSKTSDELKAGNELAGNFEYFLATPMRMLVSGAFVLNEVKDVTRQKGFITADVEWVNYRGTRYRAADETNTADVDYYNGLNTTIKERYKNAFNIRVGGELKFKTLMARAGFGWLGSPFAISDLQGTRTLVSGGLGYRHHGMFIDVAYQHAFIKYSDVPYWLADFPSPVADGKNSRGQVVLTVGFKFL